MPSFKKALKSNQKTHRERSQPAARAHLGSLEKKKDYKVRANEYQKKQATLKVLKRKAEDKNPDEFYFKMVKTRMEDGVHQTEDQTPQYTPEQLMLMTSQDIKYVHYKRGTERKKIEKLKGSLHLLDAKDKPKNSHVVFVDSKKEAKSFDAAKHFDTHPALVDRTHNRLRLSDLKSSKLASLDADTIQAASNERKKSYKELEKRIDRERQLNVIAEKMQMKKNLMDKKSKKKLVAAETVDKAAVYRWVPQRKR